MHSTFMLFSSILFLTNSKAKVLATNNHPIEAMNDGKHDFLELEDEIAVGSSINLSEDETIVNNIIMAWKHKELDESFTNPWYFNFSKSYLQYRNDIKKSKVYQTIKRMPKGGILHVHNSLILDVDAVLRLTREPSLYICIDSKSFDLFFSKTKPTRPCRNKWNLLQSLRSRAKNITKFDEDFSQLFTIKAQDLNGNVNEIWKKFEEVHRNIKKLITYRPVREKYIYQSLKKIYEDNVFYAEFRSGLNSVYEIDGSWHDEKYAIELCRRVVHEFKRDHPDFIGVKLIVTTQRRNTVAQVQDALNMTRFLKIKYPDMIVGFDLIGQEDKGRPLADFVPVLSEAKKDLNYYFHAGETNWNGMTSDKNLFDAIVLGSKRIGHAYGLLKHPSAIKAIMDQDIAIEANVISNNVLGLVKDIRNHPLATYLAMGLPIVLSSDDPGVWGAEPLSSDFFVTFMGIANRDADLRLLKQLALNSIKYSALSDSCKVEFIKVFDRRWNKFIRDLIKTDLP